MPEPGDYRITARARGADDIERAEATPIIITRLPAFKPLATPTITSPATDVTVAAGEVTFAGTGEPAREVVLVVDSKEIGRTQVAEDGNWSIALPLAAADHDVHSYTIDDAGNALMSNSVHLTATGSAPAAGAVMPPVPAAQGGTADSDGDAVADAEDKCAGTPGGVRVDASGCPLQGETLLTLAGVTFESGEATIRSDATAALDEAVKLLQENSGLSIIIEGHTDDRGDENYNVYLSQQRAEAVRKYLLDHGIAAERLEAVGKGESEPLGSNESEQTRVKNRRVEFVVK
jgi:OOP family OmpA-OmpF porin